MNLIPYALYAEDDANTAQLFLSVLSQHNSALRIVHVWNGEEALEFLRGRGRFDGRERQNPAVIFLDLEMPRLDGIEALMEIKGDPDFRAIPVVMFASPRNSDKLKRSYELGANAHVAKPADFRKFAQFVRTLGDFWLTINEAPTGCVRHI